MNDSEKYLSSLNLDQLLELLEDAIRHRHYCPCECHCFDRWEHKYTTGAIKDRITEMNGESLNE